MNLLKSFILAEVAWFIFVGTPYVLEFILGSGSNYGTHPVRLFALIPLFFALPFLFIFTKNTFPFWQAQATPGLAIQFYLINGALYLLGAFVIAYIEYSIVGGFLGSMVLFYAGGYTISVFIFARHREEAELKKVTTGKLSNQKDLEKAEFLKRSPVYLGVGDFKFAGVARKQAVFAPKFGHIMTYGATGSGKTTSTVIPNLINWPGSLFVVDPKGELAAQTAQARMKMGQNVVFLNPSGVLDSYYARELGQTYNGSSSYNPLQVLVDRVQQTNDPNVGMEHKMKELSDARTIAHILIPESPSEAKEQKWLRNGARNILIVMMLFLAFTNKDQASLITLRRVIADDPRIFRHILQKIASEMKHLLCGELSLLANSIIKSQTDEPDQAANVYTEALDALSIYTNYGHIKQAVTAKNSFCMKALVTNPTTVYMIPARGTERIAYRPWMTLVLASVFETIGLYGSNALGKQVMVMVDEFGNIGNIPSLEEKLLEYRSYGLRAWLILQYRNQLITTYGKDRGELIESACTTHQILSTELEHAKKLSASIGKTGQLRHSNQGVPGQTSKDLNSLSTSVEQKDILEPSEILSLNGQNKQLIISREVQPNQVAILEKAPYWELDPINKKVPAFNPVENRNSPKPQRVIKFPT